MMLVPALAAARSGETDVHAEDLRLMAAFVAGDTRAFRRLFERHYEKVVVFCLRFVGERAAAEELAQEAFLRLHRARERWEPTARFRTYLFTIAHRLCLNELRRPERRAPRPLVLGEPTGADADGPTLELVDEDAADPETTTVDRQRLVQVAAVLEEMPPRQRAATILNRFDGLSYEEIAQVLDCSTRAVKSLLNRSRHLIVERLGEEGGGS